MFTGKCNCGKIQYEVNVPEEDALSGIGCHCKSCVTASSGNSFNIKLPLAALKVKQGTPKVFEDSTAKSGKPVHRNFCGDCGSALWTNTDSDPSITFLKVGPLSIVDKVRMDVEIFCENASPNTLRSTTTHLDSKLQPFKE